MSTGNVHGDGERTRENWKENVEPWRNRQEVSAKLSCERPGAGGEPGPGRSARVSHASRQEPGFQSVFIAVCRSRTPGRGDAQVCASRPGGSLIGKPPRLATSLDSINTPPRRPRQVHPRWSLRLVIPRGTIASTVLRHGHGGAQRRHDVRGVRERPRTHLADDEMTERCADVCRRCAGRWRPRAPDGDMRGRSLTGGRASAPPRPPPRPHLLLSHSSL